MTRMKKAVGLDMLKFPLPKSRGGRSFHPSKGLRMKKGSGRITTKSTEKRNKQKEVIF